MILKASGLTLPGRLFGVSLSIARGELVCLVGPNGSGKTSLLHAVAGIGGPGGEVSIDGVDPRGVPPAARPGLLSFLPASRDIKWPLIARDLIALGGGAAFPEGLELEPLLDRRVDRLSTGERGRVLIARALAARPKLLLLDEPTAGMAAQERLESIRLVHRVAQELGVSCVFTEHDMSVVFAVATRITVMHQGRVLAEGTPQEVRATREVQQVYLGEPA